MKKILLTLCVLLSVVTVQARKSPNYPLPQRPDTLRILGIGNSFTDDGMMYLPELLEAAGIHNVILARLYIGGCSLERHCNEYENDTNAYKYYKSTDNKWVTVSKEAKLVDGLADENWDIVVLQQKSGISGMYETYQPWLDKLVEIVRWNCGNAGASIVWQQTWAYSRTSDHRDFPNYNNDQNQMYDSIVSAVEQMMEETGITTIIPTGTAIQNMRQTEFCDELDLPRDGYHLSKTLGRYTAACTWFQSIIAPCLGTSISGNTALLEGTKYRISEAEAKACQEAARRACIRPLEVCGKQVLFVGNSFIYYGGCVAPGGQGEVDDGIFSRICSANGERTLVYDCTYGGHHLRDFTEAGCVSPKLHTEGASRGCGGVGTDLLKGVDLYSIDYLFFSESGDNNANFLEDVRNLIARFPNPKTHFVCLVHSYTYLKNHNHILDALPELESMGVKVVPWGELVYDLSKGKLESSVPGVSYTANSFIKNKGDRHHPNPLAGYVTAQMAYCAMTGRAAQGQTYSFCDDVVGFDEYIQQHYRSVDDTNFRDIFASAAAMSELQGWIDQYLEAASGGFDN